MAYERKPGDIAVFKNEKKEKDTHPDWKGELLTPGGEKLEVALWAKGGKGTMLAGSVKPAREQSRPKARDDFNAEDVPF